jgi:hypothetical protein
MANPIVPAASYPPLQKAQERGIPYFDLGKESEHFQRVGHPPKDKMLQVANGGKDDG